MYFFDIWSKKRMANLQEKQENFTGQKRYFSVYF